MSSLWNQPYVIYSSPLKQTRSAGECSFMPFYRQQTKFANVMFLHLSVILFRGGLRYHPPRTRHPPGPDTPQDQTHPGPDTPQSRQPQDQAPPRTRHTPRDQAHPPGPGTPLPESRDGYCCGRYASSWNAFLFGNRYESQEFRQR